ncbi:aromatase/cyclase [Streptomyces sp. NBC_01429]|uniref:aromatase/cyclase n=1 Tax=Streptomyces sp. NBC_01429 TaxID=2903862 RepID=UPI002E29AB65|nr:aromatase/cyclase [Streptomyces sp. NBC_01429]
MTATTRPAGTARPTTHRTEHTRIVSAPAQVLYDLVADATRWPAIFGPSVHLVHLERGGRGERFEIWALVNGEVANWVSRRVLDPERRYVSFRQERSHPPVAAMGGGWLFRELPGGRTEVVLRHRFAATDDDPATVEGLLRGLDRNSAEELAALARVAELGHPVEDVVFSFTDRVPLEGPAEAAYDFVNRADLWAERLPHVAGVELTETVPGVQELRMDTVTADGSAHSTRSVRVCRAPEWIAYKQLAMPRLLSGHSGLWTFTEGPDGPVASATHTVVLNPAAVAEVLGEGSTLADARNHIRDALGRNSLATMSHAASHAASRAADRAADRA